MKEDKIARHLVRMGKKMYVWESQTERDHYKDQVVGRWMILNWILEG
jgi:hypothetical protein